MSDILIRFIICLLLTIAAEGIFILLITRSVKYLRYSVICNIITNPALNLTLTLLGMQPWLSQNAWYIILAVSEIIVVLAEAWFYHLLGMKKLRALMLSLLLNCASFAVGVMLLW